MTDSDHPHQDEFTATAHLEMVCKAFRSGHAGLTLNAVEAAERHLRRMGREL